MESEMKQSYREMFEALPIDELRDGKVTTEYELAKARETIQRLEPRLYWIERALDEKEAAK
jgi:hypothetical protein